MDLINQINRLVKVRFKDLESIIRRNRDLNFVLRMCCKPDLIYLFILANIICQMNTFINKMFFNK